MEGDIDLHLFFEILHACAYITVQALCFQLLSFFSVCFKEKVFPCYQSDSLGQKVGGLCTLYNDCTVTVLTVFTRTTQLLYAQNKAI